MPFHLSIKEENDYIIMKSTGTINNFDEQTELAREQTDLIIKYNVKKVISDVTELQYSLDSFNIVDVASLVKFYIDSLPTQLKSYLIAAVLNEMVKDVIPKARFWETYTRNRGFNFRVFYSMEDALKCIQDE